MSYGYLLADGNHKKQKTNITDSFLMSHTWWLFMALTSASNTLQSLSAMQQLGSPAHPDKSLMRACKQEAALWEKELMASLDSPTESHLPSTDCMRQQLAASVLFVPCVKQTQVYCYFSLFSPPAAEQLCFPHSQANSLEQGNWIPPPLCANCSTGSREECVPST